MKKRTKTKQKRSTNSEVEIIKKDIRSLRDSGKSDTEIRETLGLELRNYQKYAHIIHLEDQKVWLSVSQEQLSGQLLRMKQSLEHSYRIALAMSEDEKADIGERLEALNKKDDSRLSLIHLLSEYPLFIKATQTQTQTQPSEEYTKNVEISEQGSPINIKASTLKRIH